MRVAHVEGDAVEDDAIRVDGVEHGIDLGIGEDVEALFAKEDFAAVVLHLGDEIGRGVWVDPQGILRSGFGHFLLTRGARDAMGGKGVLKVWPVGEFGVVQAVVVNRAEDGDALVLCVAREALEIGQDRFRAGDVEVAVGHDEVVLGVDVPEYDTGHEGLLSAGTRDSCVMIGRWGERCNC